MLLTIRVVKVGARGPQLGEIVYIGRAARGYPASPLANPYHIGRDGSRATVIAKYRVWLDRELANPESAASKEISRLVGLLLTSKENAVALMCWCAPLACHGDVVREKMWATIGAPPPGTVAFKQATMAP